jgi:hypothetical protein
MAKIAFSKLGLTKDKLDEFQTVEFNDQTVEVKQYLPIAEKAELISRVLNNSVDDDAGYYNNLKLDMWLALEIVYAYSNISFTEKQKSDPMKLYDLLSSNKLLNLIIGLVPESEFYYLTKVTHELATAIYTYRNSALGILDSIGRDYSNLNLDATEIQKKLADPENLTLLKNVVEKLG